MKKKKTKHNSCSCTCKFDENGRKCNSLQKWKMLKCNVSVKTNKTSCMQSRLCLEF